jgi:NAD(P)-dependent dehydrogenase (short-subunit alcohol dehydrogenase family)
MASLKGEVLLITGGAQGLGLHTAGEFVKEGCTIVLTDINEKTLAKAKDILSKKGAIVHTYKVDVTKREEVEQLANDILDRFGKVDILINNAGIGHHAELEDTSIETWQKLMNVNFWGPLYHIYAFLPSMKARGKGHIVNISSGQAFFRLPTWGAYATIKLAIGAVSDILYYELKKHNINVTTVYPYVVHTGFYNDIDSQSPGGRMSMLLLPFYSQKPEQVGRTIYRAVMQHKKDEMVHPINTIAKFINFFPSVSYLSNSLLTVVMSKQEKSLREKGRVMQLLENTFNSAGSLLERASGGIGFGIDETMTGEHTFEEGEGPSGSLPFEFNVHWGAKNLAKFSNPFDDSFLTSDLEGTLSIGGWGEDIPCKGTLQLKYFDEQKIRYTLDFKYKNKSYRYVGEKIHIYPWNLPYSHTTCFGEIRKKKSNRLISTSVTHFQLEKLPEFLKSLHLERAKGIHVTPAPVSV